MKEPMGPLHNSRGVGQRNCPRVTPGHKRATCLLDLARSGWCGHHVLKRQCHHIVGKLDREFCEYRLSDDRKTLFFVKADCARVACINTQNHARCSSRSRFANGDVEQRPSNPGAVPARQDIDAFEFRITRLRTRQCCCIEHGIADRAARNLLHNPHGTLRPVQIRDPRSLRMIVADKSNRCVARMVIRKSFKEARRPDQSELWCVVPVRPPQVQSASGASAASRSRGRMKRASSASLAFTSAQRSHSNRISARLAVGNFSSTS